MTDIVEEARALLAQATYGSEEWDTSAFPDTIKTADKRMFAAAPRLLAALADECERLRAENEQHVDFRASINEALPRPFGVTVLGAIAELRTENAQQSAEIAQLRAENARLREAMPSDDVRLIIEASDAICDGIDDDHTGTPGVVMQWLASLDAAKGVR